MTNFPALCLLMTSLAGAAPLGPSDNKDAVDLLRTAATQGDASAIAKLEKRLYTRDEAAEKAGAAKSLAENLRKAKAGDPEAMTAVGNTLTSTWPWPVGTKEERAQAPLWFAKARDHYLPIAKKGDAEAQHRLALVLRWAPQPVGNDAEAYRWRKKAAAQGHPQAMTALADLLVLGAGVARDEAKAFALYEQAAAAGDSKAAHSLGMYYFLGKGDIKPDQAKSEKWMMQADAMGSREDGCYFGGRFFGQWGNAYPQDYARAMALITPRAEAGVIDCFKDIAQAYEKGTGVPKDEAEAYKWFALAVLYKEPAFSYSERNALERLKKSLDPKLVRDGEQRAYAFEFTPMAEAPAAPAIKFVASAPAAPAAVAPEPSVDAPARRLKTAPNDFALIVGIERYRSLPAADYAENDAAAVHRHLADLGVPERNIISLKGDEATRSKLQAYLEEWLPKNVTADSRVYFYFSGHGSPDSKSGQAYLIPSDGDPSYLKSTAFAVKDVYAALNRLPAKQVIVALDSCFSGAGGRSVLPKGARPLVAKIELTGETGKLLVFAAAAGDEISGGLDEQRHGAFTYYFLRGLSGEAKTPAGTVTADSLQSYLRGRVGDAAHRQNRDQTPQMIGDPGTILTRF